jgi:hypothetical protein
MTSLGSASQMKPSTGLPHSSFVAWSRARLTLSPPPPCGLASTAACCGHDSSRSLAGMGTCLLPAYRLVGPLVSQLVDARSFGYNGRRGPADRRPCNVCHSWHCDGRKRSEFRGLGRRFGRSNVLGRLLPMGVVLLLDRAVRLFPMTEKTSRIRRCKDLPGLACEATGTGPGLKTRPRHHGNTHD